MLPLCDATNILFNTSGIKLLSYFCPVYSFSVQIPKSLCVYSRSTHWVAQWHVSNAIKLSTVRSPVRPSVRLFVHFETWNIFRILAFLYRSLNILWCICILFVDFGTVFDSFSLFIPEQLLLFWQHFSPLSLWRTRMRPLRPVASQSVVEKSSHFFHCNAA